MECKKTFLHVCIIHIPDILKKNKEKRRENKKKISQSPTTAIFRVQEIYLKVIERLHNS